MLFGGVVNEVEVINLEDEDAFCNTLAQYPVPIEYPTVAFINGFLESCGGLDDGVITSACYLYSFDTNSWSQTTSLSLAREFPASSVIGGEWLISGGPNIGIQLGSTEVRINGVSTPGPRLHDGVFAACQVTINATHIFLADGHDGFTYILEWETKNWILQVTLIA